MSCSDSVQIFFLAGAYAPEALAVSIRSRSLVTALKSVGVRVEVITSGRDRCIDGVKIWGVSRRDSVDQSLLLRLVEELYFSVRLGLKLVARLRACPDKNPVVIVSSPPFWLAVVGAWIASFRCLRFGVDVRDRYPEVLFTTGILKRTNLVALLLLRAESLLYKTSLVVTAATSSIAVDLERECQHGSFSVVRNGFDPEVFQPDLTLAPPSPQGIRVVMHGLFGRFFDLNFFRQFLDLSRASRLPIELTIIGYGPQFDAIKRIEYSALRVFESMPQRRLAQHVAASHVLLSCHTDNRSMRGAFPVKVFEAIGAGLPSIVVPKSEAGLELAERGMGWAYDSDQAEEVVRQLGRLSQSPSLWLGARESVLNWRSDYFRSVQAQKFAELWSLALSRSSMLQTAAASQAD